MALLLPRPPSCDGNGSVGELNRWCEAGPEGACPMNGSAFPALASQVSVSVAGAGSYLPEHRVSNEEILRYLRPARPDGRLLEPEWVVKHLAIHERRLDYEFGGRRKRSRADGGIYDGDLTLAGGALGPGRRRHRRRGRRPVRPRHLDSGHDLLPGPLPLPDERARAAARRRSGSPQPRLCRSRRGLPHRRRLARLRGAGHRAGGGKQLPVGLLRSRSPRLLLQPPERHGLAGSAHVRRRRRCRRVPLGPAQDPDDRPEGTALGPLRDQPGHRARDLSRRWLPPPHLARPTCRTTSS